MSVNLEVKGTLAKLLATEDLIVEHKSVSTASFNVKSRVLTLPLWERASSNVMDLLIAHEVGHALFTPNEDWRDKCSCPMSFVNVTEDARIENLMKQKFAGLPKTFYKGYYELHDKDFFSIEDEEVNEMSVVDRVNLYFKVGNFVKIDFSDAEMVVVRQVAAARTFDEALAAAEALYAIHQENKMEQQQSQEDISAQEDGEQEAETGEEGESEEQQPGEADSDPTETEGSDDNDGEGEEEQESTDTKEVEEEQGGGGDASGDLSDEVKTMDSFNEALESMTSTATWNQPEYVTYPTIKTDKYIVPNKVIHEHIQESFTRQKDYFIENCGERADRFINDGWTVHEEDFAKFKREVQSEVNYMVKEFECKKSAAAYARASTARTGVLDCTKLHTYKYNDDIFKKITTLPEGKNHGLLFVLDWSGSMCDILKDTMKQLISLVMFCDKVGIPFDVYAFTNEWNERDYYTKEEIEESGVFHLSQEFSLMNILTSKVNRKELQRQMETMYTIASSYSTRSFDIVPNRVGLSGTPLNESLVVLRSLLPEFKAQNNVEKAHVMVLTDGEAAICRVTRETEDYKGETHLTAGRLYGSNTYLRNRKTGTIVKIKDNATPGAVTTSLLEDLRREFPESSFTGFRILESRGGWFIRQATGYDDKLQSQWRKDKSIALTNFGYHKYFVVSSNSIQESAEFEVAEDASKAKIKSAFAKSLKSKKNNKKILGDFISLIA